MGWLTTRNFVLQSNYQFKKRTIWLISVRPSSEWDNKTKLFASGITDILQRLHWDYLTFIIQINEVKKIKSKKIYVNFGVPHRSHLGPFHVIFELLKICISSIVLYYHLRKLDFKSFKNIIKWLKMGSYKLQNSCEFLYV